MPRFQVKLIKEVRKIAYVEVDAEDGDAAEVMAINLANDARAKVMWSWEEEEEAEEDRTIEVVDVYEIEAK
jgi:hypothetical protein